MPARRKLSIFSPIGTEQQQPPTEGFNFLLPSQPPNMMTPGEQARTTTQTSLAPFNESPETTRRRVTPAAGPIDTDANPATLTLLAQLSRFFDPNSGGGQGGMY